MLVDVGGSDPELYRDATPGPLLPTVDGGASWTKQ